MHSLVLRRSSWLIFFWIVIVGLGIGTLAAVLKVTSVNGFRMGWQGIPLCLAFRRLQHPHPVVVPRELLVDFGPKEAVRVPDIIGLEEFDRLFTRFEHTAWRLETRRRYASDELTETYTQFTHGASVNWDGVDTAWCFERRDQVALGKRFDRVRIVDDPPTPGQFYLLDNARRNSVVGERIHNLRREDADRLALPAEDFWLFDSRLVALLNFDDTDNLVDVELITQPAEVLRYVMVRDAAEHHAVYYAELAENLSAKEN